MARQESRAFLLRCGSNHEVTPGTLEVFEFPCPRSRSHPMSPLRQRMIRELELHRKAPSTYARRAVSSEVRIRVIQAVLNRR